MWNTILVSTLLGGLSLIAAASAQSPDDLPDSVVALVESRFPGYRIPNAGDVGGQWSASDTGDHPAYLGRADFDGDDRIDTAVFLLGEADWQLVVFRQIESDSHRAEVLERFPGSDREWKRAHPAQSLRLKTVTGGETLQVHGETIALAESEPGALVMLLPDSAKTVLLFQWDRERGVFGVTRVRF